MQQNPFFVIVAIVTVLFGLAFLFIPDQLASWYGTAAIDNLTRLDGRYLGSTLIGLAIIYFMARDQGASSALTGLLWGGLVANVIELVIVFVATTGSVLNALGWVNVVIHILLGAGFAYLLFVKPAST